MNYELNQVFDGELISLLVAVMWTFTALFAEVASRRMGNLVLNVWRMLLTIALIGIVLWWTCGKPWPQFASREVWMWFMASGFVGFVFGDYCLFNAYIVMGSRFGQLFMTLASPFAAIAAWMLMGETMGQLSLLGMVVTLSGIAISIMGKDEKGSRHLTLPYRGILFGIGAALGQGIGLVLSKQGLLHYASCVPPMQTGVADMIPFAGTQMRAVMGLAGFSILLVCSGKVADFFRSATDLRGCAAGLGAILLGPFFGVSLSLKAVGMTNTGVAQTLMSLTPVLIIWPSKWFFRTKVSAQEIVGAIIAVAGASLFFL